MDEPRHQISHGKWHGDIVIHTFKIKNADKKSTEIYYARAKSMMHIRHENIVSFMGASICADSIEYDVRNYSIITNPVKADSLFAKSAELPGMYGATKMSIANQVRLSFLFQFFFSFFDRELGSGSILSLSMTCLDFFRLVVVAVFREVI